ncbi:MAG: PEP/pyruvate-binding domain-containing protein [Acidobacteria bacterium]|nr:PEP/pyruvate-binding domain-containing protein [Acidobacteriota bacterium]MBI3424920.1 PEP/pyruvate-binding domain-containing protein [Acidobacteriota bacterium]
MRYLLLLGLFFCHTCLAAAQSRAAQPAVKYLPRLTSRADFDRLSRVYYQGRFYALPHLMFVVDRAAQNKVYFINSQRYAFHSEFVNASYLTLERGREFFRHNYLEATRRFVLGTIAYQTRLDKYTFEFWEGDLATSEIVRETQHALNASFFAPLYFKPNSARQEEVAAQLPELPKLLPSETNAPQDYLPLNQAQNAGVLRILDRLTDDIILDRNEIVVFGEPPLTLTPVSGIITTTFSTPLAHVNLLAKNWGVPNAYIKGAAETFQPLAGKFVYFETRDDGYTLRPATVNETAERGRQLAKRSDLITPAADLEFRELTALKDQRSTEAKRFGAKSANLGELLHAVHAGTVRDITVPSGFTIPFYYYEQFLRAHKLDEALLELLGNDRFNHDAAYRKERLAELRGKIQAGSLNAEFSRAVLAKKRLLFGGKGVFARSSTNSEDLPNFNGAGLYTSVPNVRDDQALLAAIKTVWASLWNYEAYEARESFGINHSGVYPAVLIQEGINAEAAGVLITTNPFDRSDHGAVYVNAKRGLGMRVVEGRRVPEQLLFTPKSNAVRVLTRSGDDTLLTFDDRGGVREVKIETERAVLTDAVVRRLARAALQIQRVFRGVAQDIEWITIGTQIYIVQSRPYVETR